MTKKIFNYFTVIFILTLFLVPSFVLASEEESIIEKYNLTMEKINITSYIGYNSDGYDKILHVSDYIYIHTLGGYIKKLDSSLEVVEEFSTINKISDLDTQIVDNNIYILLDYYNSNTRKYELKFFKYNNNFELQIEKTFNINTSSYRSIYHQEKHYVFYKENNTNYLMILDINGNILINNPLTTNIDINYYGENTLVKLNEQLYLISYDYTNNYKTLFYSVEENGNVNLKKTINDYEITKIIQDKNDTAIAIGYYADDDEPYILKLDKNFNITKKINYIDSVNDPSIELNPEKIYKSKNSYIFVGRTEITNSQGRSNENFVILFFDSNLKYQYALEYENDLVKENGNGSADIYIDGNNMYVASSLGCDGYTNNAGNIILKYALDSYSINTEIINGKGTITSNVENALPGEKVIVTPVPENGYEIKKISVFTKEGQEIELNNNIFIMPSEEVFIKVEFVKIEANPNTSGTISITLIIILVLCITLTAITHKKYNWLKG